MTGKLLVKGRKRNGIAVFHYKMAIVTALMLASLFIAAISWTSWSASDPNFELVNAMYPIPDHPVSGAFGAFDDKTQWFYIQKIAIGVTVNIIAV